MVGADDHPPLMVVDLVFDARLARENGHRHLTRVIEIEEQNLGRFVVMDVDEGIAIILRAIEADEPPGIRLAIDLDIGFLRLARRWRITR